MDGLNPQVLRGFGIKNRNIQRSKGHYIIFSDSGKKVIKKTGGQREAVEFQHAVKQHLLEEDFLYIDHFYLSLQGTPYYLFDNSLYTMTDYPDYPELDFCDDNLFLALAEAVGKMHAKARHISYEGWRPQGEDATAVFAEGEQKMAGVKKMVKNQGKLSDFDLLVLRNYDYFMDRIVRAGAVMNRSAYRVFRQEALKENAVCHNLLKKENLYWDGSNVHITNFSECSADYFMADVAQLIHRHIKYRKEESMSITEILAPYNKFNKLSVDDMEILYAFLLYPAAFVKICGQYYSKKRSWIPGAFTARMDQVMEQRKYYDKLLETGF